MVLKNAAKACLASIYYFLYILPFEGKKRRIALFYHGIKDDDVCGFESQMHYLSRHAKAIPPSAIRSHPDYNGILVAVTFDDAFLNLQKNALPIMERYNVPAAICVPAGNLGKAPEWDLEEGCDDGLEGVMNERDIIDVRRRGFELFSHTMTHPRLTDLDADNLEYELAESRRILEKMLKEQITAISYPHGACDRRVFDAARKAGYALGFTIEPEIITKSTDNLQIGRTSISPGDSLFVFMLKLNGAYGIFPLIKKIKRFFWA